MNSTTKLWDKRRAVVCIGTGGVGKTTVAAALALAAAQDGRRVAVLTIDPSRRLAQALGLRLDCPTPQPVDLGAHGLPLAKGTLTAQMLDVQHTFDSLVRARSSSPEHAELILKNRIYQNFSASLVGSHEYAAVEKFWDLLSDDAYDLVIVDTPPSQNAIDFFGAPARILSFLEGQGVVNKVPGASLAKKISRTIFDLGGTLVTKTVGKVAGASTLEEILSFLSSLSAMYGSFEQRARAVEAMLTSEACAFCLVGGPAPTQIAALEHFVSELANHKLSPWGTVINRMHPAPLPPHQAEALAPKLAEQLALLPVSKQVLQQLSAAIESEQLLANRDWAALARLRESSKGRPVLALEEMAAATQASGQLTRLSALLLAQL